jgi:hypothetical protein
VLLHLLLRHVLLLPHMSSLYANHQVEEAEQFEAAAAAAAACKEYDVLHLSNMCA